MFRNLRTLFPYLVRYRWRYVAGMAALVFKSFTAASIPLLIGLVVDDLTREFTLEALMEWAAILLLLAAVKGLFQYWMRWILIGASRQIEFDLRSDLFGHLANLSQRFYQSYRTGDLMSRATNDMNAVRLLLGPGIMYSVDTFLTFAVVLSVLSSTDWRLTALVFVPIPLISFTVSHFGRRIHERFQRVQATLSDISSMVQENLANVRMVRAYVQEDAEIERFRGKNRQYVDENLNLVKLWGRFYPLLEVLIGTTYVIVLWYGGRRVLAGSLSVGDFVMFMTYMAALVWPMASIGWVVNIVQRGTASLERLNELLRQSPEVADSAETDWSIQTIRGDLEFRNVTVYYPGAERPALEDINLVIPAGSKLAVIGATGSGKTTLVKLIPRLIEPYSGTLFVDGTGIRRVPLEVLRRSIGFVPQETFLFSETIGNNIAFGVDEPSHWELAQAAEAAVLAGDVETFPERYQTLVGERGITLSGGQKQRTTLARAIVRDPRILILDDSLSSVDTETEERILEQLRVQLRNRTTVLISHRVSTARFADQIAVLEQGRIIELGSNEELLERKGAYYRLYQKQLLEEELQRA